MTAAAAITGDEIAAGEQEKTNAANMAMNTSNQNFNAFQAQLGRQFSAGQVQQQEQFQQGQVLQQENYQTQMSDTALQRRMADARAAGVNPLLAIGAGGASSPTGSAMSGNAASASTASAPSMIPMQNPGAAFAGMGNQMASAMQTQTLKAQTDNIEANTNLTNQKAGVELPAQVNYIKAMTNTTEAQARQIAANIGLMEQQANEVGQHAELYGMQTNLTQQLQNIATQDLAVKQGTVQALINSMNSDAAAKQLKLEALKAWADSHTGDIGSMIQMFNAVLGPVSSAVGIATGHPSNSGLMQPNY